MYDLMRMERLHRAMLENWGLSILLLDVPTEVGGRPDDSLAHTVQRSSDLENCYARRASPRFTGQDPGLRGGMGCR
jgi:hypothetical protein